MVRMTLYCDGFQGFAAHLCPLLDWQLPVWQFQCGRRGAVLQQSGLGALPCPFGWAGTPAPTAVPFAPGEWSNPTGLVDGLDRWLWPGGGQDLGPSMTPTLRAPSAVQIGFPPICRTRRGEANDSRVS